MHILSFARDKKVHDLIRRAPEILLEAGVLGLKERKSSRGVVLVYHT